MGKPKGRSDLYHLYRLVERFPKWIHKPSDFFHFPERKKITLLTYEIVRELEEQQAIDFMRMSASVGK